MKLVGLFIFKMRNHLLSLGQKLTPELPVLAVNLKIGAIVHMMRFHILPFEESAAAEMTLHFRGLALFGVNSQILLTHNRLAISAFDLSLRTLSHMRCNPTALVPEFALFVLALHLGESAFCFEVLVKVSELAFPLAVQRFVDAHHVQVFDNVHVEQRKFDVF